MKRSKAYQNAAEKIDREHLYSPAEAVELAKATQVTKFDPTVEVNLRLGVDPRKQDQMVRGTVNLPNGTGKTARVLVFATGPRAEEATAARCSGPRVQPSTLMPMERAVPAMIFSAASIVVAFRSGILVCAMSRT